MNKEKGDAEVQVFSGGCQTQRKGAEEEKMIMSRHNLHIMPGLRMYLWPSGLPHF